MPAADSPTLQSVSAWTLRRCGPSARRSTPSSPSGHCETCSSVSRASSGSEDLDRRRRRCARWRVGSARTTSGAPGRRGRPLLGRRRVVDGGGASDACGNIDRPGAWADGARAGGAVRAVAAGAAVRAASTRGARVAERAAHGLRGHPRRDAEHPRRAQRVLERVEQRARVGVAALRVLEARGASPTRRAPTRAEGRERRGWSVLTSAITPPGRRPPPRRASAPRGPRRGSPPAPHVARASWWLTREGLRGMYGGVP